MKAMDAGGRSVQLDVRAWGHRERHVGSIVVIVAAAVLLAGGVALQLFARAIADVALWAIVGVMILLLAYEALAVGWGLRADRAAARPEEPAPPDAADAAASAGATAASPETYAEWAPPPAEGEPVAPPAGPPPDAGPQILTLRCGQCQTVFDVQDLGVRPLYHVCPGCGAEGVLRADPMATRHVDPAKPVEELKAKDEWRAPDLPEPKKVKLRCGACKHVFEITDTGERPLRNRCPSCGKLGEKR